MSFTMNRFIEALRFDSTPYSLLTKFSGHRDAIKCLALSQSGAVLASGGMDGIRMWDLRSREQLHAALPIWATAERGGATCMKWVPKLGKAEVLVSGTTMGYVVFWRPEANHVYHEMYSARLDTGVEILSIASKNLDKGTTRVAAGNGDRAVIVLNIDAQSSVTVLFSVRLYDTVPGSLSFSNNEQHDLWVFGGSNKIKVLNGSSGLPCSSIAIESPIDKVAVSANRDYFLRDNGIDGLALHDTTDGSCVRQYKIGERRKGYPIQVAFAEKGQIVVSGSDHGSVYVFNRETGKLCGRLKHKENGGVDTITTLDRPQSTIIASASSDNCGDYSICVWRGHTQQDRMDHKKGGENRITPTDLLKDIAHLAIIILTGVIIYNSFHPDTRWNVGTSGTSTSGLQLATRTAEDWWSHWSSQFYQIRGGSPGHSVIREDPVAHLFDEITSLRQKLEQMEDNSREDVLAGESRGKAVIYL